MSLNDDGFSGDWDLPSNSDNAEGCYEVYGDEDVENFKSTEWIINGVIPKGGLCALYGAPGMGKSLLALDIGTHVANGIEWFGRAVTEVDVLYCYFEGQNGLKQRLKAIKKDKRIQSSGLSFQIDSFEIQNYGNLEMFINTINKVARENRSLLIVIDTLNAVMSGSDENDSKTMGRVIKNLRAVINASIDTTILLVHHTGKDRSKGLRGHSSLHAALDAEIYITEKNGQRKWETTKMRDAECSAMGFFELKGITLENELNNKSSVVVSQLKSVTNKPAFNLGPNERVVYEVLTEMDDVTNGFEPVWHEVSEILVQTKERLTCQDNKKSERVRAALSQLSKKGFVEIDNSLIRLKDCI